MEVSFCSLKKIKSLLNPFMSSALPPAYRLLPSILQQKALQRRRLKAKETEKKKKVR